jgi:hypothetical protein
VRVIEGGEIFVRIVTSELDRHLYFDSEVTLSIWLQESGGNESLSSPPLVCSCHPNRPPVIITTFHGPGMKNFETADKKHGKKVDRFYLLHSRPNPQ